PVLGRAAVVLRPGDDLASRDLAALRAQIENRRAGNHDMPHATERACQWIRNSFPGRVTHQKLGNQARRIAEPGFRGRPAPKATDAWSRRLQIEPGDPIKRT